MFDVYSVKTGTFVNITYDTTLLGSNKMVEVLGQCGYGLAKDNEDVDATHANIYSSLEANPVNNLTGASFLIFNEKTNNGYRKRYVADMWIRNVQVVKKVKVSFDVELDSLDEISHVTKALASRGLNDVDYKIITND